LINNLQVIPLDHLQYQLCFQFSANRSASACLSLGQRSMEVISHNQKPEYFFRLRLKIGSVKDHFV